MKSAENSHRHRCASERGAIIIYVALALLTLLAFSAFIVDYGVMWVSRRQAQNAADAAALAGARSLPINGGANAEAVSAAVAFAGLTPIWGQNTAAADVVVSSLPFACPASAVGGGSCIRVDVIRGTADRSGTTHANTLPVFFGGLVGVTPQGVRATATAQGAPGNAVRCMMPWLVADRWLEGDETPPPWSQNATFNPLPPNADSYVPPSLTSTTGFTVADNYGLQLVLKPGVIGAWSAGWTQEIDLGSATTEEQISGCPSFVPTVGIYNPSVGPCAAPGDATDAARGCVNVKTGLSPVTSDGVRDLVARDSDAVWDSSTKRVIEFGGISERVVPLAVFNTLAYYNESPACGTPGCVAQVVNIVGFFVEGMCNKVTLDPGVSCPDPSSDVVGRLMNYPAQILTAAGAVTPAASFLTVTRLVR
jgi:Flp pilus assembly protein TadG